MNERYPSQLGIHDLFRLRLFVLFVLFEIVVITFVAGRASFTGSATFVAASSFRFPVGCSGTR